MRLLFKGNGYRGLGFLSKEVEEVFGGNLQTSIVRRKYIIS